MWAEVMSAAAAGPEEEDWGVLAALSDVPGWVEEGSRANGLGGPGGAGAALPVDLADVADLASVLASFQLPEGAPVSTGPLTVHLGVQEEPLELDFADPDEALAALSERMHLPEALAAMGAGGGEGGEAGVPLFRPMPGLVLPGAGIGESMFGEGAPGGSFIRSAVASMGSLAGNFGENGLVVDNGEQLQAMEAFVHDAEGLLEDSMERNAEALAALASPEVQQLLSEEDKYHSLYFGDIHDAPPPVVVKETIVVEQPASALPGGVQGEPAIAILPAGASEDFPVISIVEVEGPSLPRDPARSGARGGAAGLLPGLGAPSVLLLGGGLALLSAVAVAALAALRRRRKYRLVRAVDLEFSPDSKPSLGVPVSQPAGPSEP